MKPKVIVGMMLTSLLFGMVTPAFSVQLAEAESKSLPSLPHYTYDHQADLRKSPSPGYYDTSEYLLGSIAVGIILPESIKGTYNWTETEINQTVSGIKKAMEWWTSQEPNANLSFSFDLHVQVPTIYEPIEMNIGEDFVWIEDVMSQLNYTSGSAWEKVQAYNNDIREALGTDWTFTIFVVDSNPRVNLGLFKGGGYAHAFFGGPWVTMSRYSSWAWNSANYYVAVPAHEMGHIFYATDEYNYVREYSGYLNASDKDGAYGIMNRNSFFVSASTRLQVGWRDTDGDGIMDILDTYPEIALEPYPPLINETSYLFSGTVVEIPYSNRNPHGPRNNVTINKIISVEFSVDDEPWMPASPVDGAFDEALENFTFTPFFPSGGTHSIKVRATNSVRNVRERIFMIETISPPSVSAVVDITPNTLSLRSGSKWINGFIELQEGYDVSSINVYSIMLNETIPIEEAKIGGNRLKVTFDRAKVASFILQAIEFSNRFSIITLTITGRLDDETFFEGTDTIRVLYLTKVHDENFKPR